MTETVEIRVVYKFKSKFNSALGHVRPNDTLSMTTHHAESVDSVKYEARYLLDMQSNLWMRAELIWPHGPVQITNGRNIQSNRGSKMKLKGIAVYFAIGFFVVGVLGMVFFVLLMCSVCGIQ